MVLFCIVVILSLFAWLPPSTFMPWPAHVPKIKYFIDLVHTHYDLLRVFWVSLWPYNKSVGSSTSLPSISKLGISPVLSWMEDLYADMGRGRYTSKSRGCFPTHLLNMHFVCDKFTRLVLFGDGCTGFWWRVGSWWPPGKLQYFTNDNLLLIVVAVTWLKILPIRRITLYNQSIFEQIRIKYWVPWSVWIWRGTPNRHTHCKIRLLQL